MARHAFTGTMLGLAVVALYAMAAAHSIQIGALYGLLAIVFAALAVLWERQ